MFHLKFLLLIAFASQASPARELWQDYFLQGDCINFQNTIEGNWERQRHKLEKTITQNYKGDIKMASHIFDCAFSLLEKNTFDYYKDVLKANIALYSMLKHYYQEASIVALRTAHTMYEADLAVETTARFQTHEQEILKEYVQQFKDGMQPTFKSVHFDEWVFIKHPYEDWHLAVKDNEVNMWPVDSHFLSEDSYKWSVNRSFTTDKHQNYYFQVYFINLEHGLVLAANDQGQVVATVDRKSGYHLWNVKPMKPKGGDVGRIRLQNSKTGLFLKSDECCYSTGDLVKYDVQLLTMGCERGMNLIFNQKAEF